jgi:hypothetical protein
MSPGRRWTCDGSVDTSPVALLNILSSQILGPNPLTSPSNQRVTCKDVKILFSYMRRGKKRKRWNMFYVHGAMYSHPFYTCSYMYPAHVILIGPIGRKSIEHLFEFTWSSRMCRSGLIESSHSCIINFAMTSDNFLTIAIFSRNFSIHSYFHYRSEISLKKLSQPTTTKRKSKKNAATSRQKKIFT